MPGPRITNHSREPNWKVIGWFHPRFYRRYLESAIVLPDVAPAGLVPNGTVSVVDPVWLEIFPFTKAIGDIGCAMSWGTVPGFDRSRLREAWNALFRALRGPGRAVLGSGNHFIDACDSETGALTLVVHAGPRATEQELRTFDFRRHYDGYLARARAAHDRIWKAISNEIAPTGEVAHLSHDTAIMDGGRMILRKGVTWSPPGTPVLVASSFADTLVTGVAKPTVAELGDSMSHGTGRLASRSDARLRPADQAALRARVIIPDDLADSAWRLEAPAHYRPMSRMLPFLERYVEIRDRLTPVAFMGGL